MTGTIERWRQDATSALQHTCPCDSRKRRWRHSPSQERLLRVHAVLLAAGLRRGGRRCRTWRRDLRADSGGTTAPVQGDPCVFMARARGVLSRVTRPCDSPAATVCAGSAHYTAHIRPCPRPATPCL